MYLNLCRTFFLLFALTRNKNNLSWNFHKFNEKKYDFGFFIAYYVQLSWKARKIFRFNNSTNIIWENKTKCCGFCLKSIVSTSEIFGVYFFCEFYLPKVECPPERKWFACIYDGDGQNPSNGFECNSWQKYVLIIREVLNLPEIYVAYKFLLLKYWTDIT